MIVFEQQDDFALSYMPCRVVMAKPLRDAAREAIRKDSPRAATRVEPALRAGPDVEDVCPMWASPPPD
jgi:hypothetical protein